MQTMVDWLAYLVPWWVWLVAGGGLAAIVYVKLGPKAAIALGAALAAFLIDRRGRQAGWSEREERQKQQDKEFVDDYRREESASAGRPDDELDQRNARWLRKP